VVSRERRRKTVGGALLPRVPMRCAERGTEPVNTERTRARHKRAGVISLLFAGALSFSGCEWFGLTPPTPPPPPADSLVLRGDTLAPEKQPEPGSPEAKLAGAHELFRRGEYSKAADLFHSIADKPKKTQESVVI